MEVIPAGVTPAGVFLQELADAMHGELPGAAPLVEAVELEDAYARLKLTGQSWIVCPVEANAGQIAVQVRGRADPAVLAPLAVRQLEHPSGSMSLAGRWRNLLWSLGRYEEELYDAAGPWRISAIRLLADERQCRALVEVAKHEDVRVIELQDLERRDDFIGIVGAIAEALIARREVVPLTP
ncbi:MAG: hypothetical protein M3P48_07885 [Actinomycetota bacterium]|nr:hypothetical protein [Actinomycetota bacterium]